MTPPSRWLLVVLGLVVVAETGLLAFVWRRAAWGETAARTPVQRGRALAEGLGCFGCHGPGGGQPIPNPGSKGGEVPGWTGGTWMMWNDSASDLRAWILDGHPPGREPDGGALIRMPAYRSRLSADEADALVAYVEAASHFGTIDDARAAAGHDAAYRLGCFGCHGPEGRGLVWNPGSFKGFVPPWDGDDYVELVRDATEFEQWVRQGVCDRLAANPAAKAFLARQAVPMPAYGDRVSDRELADLAAYVSWVRAHPRGKR